MINNTEEPIEDIEYFDKWKNFEIQLYRNIPDIIYNININDVINESMMSKSFI